MSRITIPPEALEKGARAAYEMRVPGCSGVGFSDWENEDEAIKEYYRDETRAAFLAIVEGWPGKDIVGYGPPFYGIDLILPLTEKTDDKA